MLLGKVGRITYPEELLCSRNDVSDYEGSAKWQDDVLIIGM